MNKCNICPRECNIDRKIQSGYCKAPIGIMLAKAAPFYFEEPIISGENGTGAVFFSGCNLKCCFCQNKSISWELQGVTVSIKKFCDILLDLQQKGVNTISLISPTPYSNNIIKALDQIKHKITVPIVYNTSGYEKPQIIKTLSDYIDIYVPDIKYMDPLYSAKYSNAPDYFHYCSQSVLEMVSQKPILKYKESGVLETGVLIRHLVMPTLYKDSINILKWIKDLLSETGYECLVSIMSQYTPYHKSFMYPEINRKITSYEYKKVINMAYELELKGFMQDKASSTDIYIPDFDLEGII